MKILTNDKLIKRNKKIGQYTTIASLVVLAGGLYLSFRSSTDMISLSLVALIIGFVLSQVGIYFGNRFGRNPRPDEILNASLKGLDDHYTIFHYTTPVSHLLLSPSGIWVLIPYFVGGKITFEKGRWKQKGGNLYLKIFGQDSLGRPDLEISSQEEDVKKALAKTLTESEIPAIQSALVFTNEKTEIQVDDPPAPTLSAEKLKDYLRKRAKEASLTPEAMDKLEKALYKG
jgi:hypothetical protein